MPEHPPPFPLPTGSGPALSAAGEPGLPGEGAGAEGAGAEGGSEGGSAQAVGGPEARYRRIGLLGEGGMGRVSTALDRSLGRVVAFKELAPHALQSAAARRRMIREAWITAQLDHPGVVAVHDAGRLPDGSPFYTMRLVRGRTLEQEMEGRQGFAARQRLLRHFLAACEAVASAHSVGILHRDLKPQNVLVGRFGETQVVDWGLACPVEGGAAVGDLAGGGAAGGDAAGEPTYPESRTLDGAVVGSPGWMSPEQARGERADRRSDVWSLGAILYEILSGSRAYPGVTGEEVLEKVRAGPPPPLRSLAPDVPPDLAAIAARALAWSPADRYPDAGALAEDLERWSEGRQVQAHRYTPAELLQRLVQAWRVPLTVGGLGLAAVVLALLIGFYRTDQARERAVEAEAETRHALAQALVERAVAALREENRAKAELLAAEALLTTESPEARGVLAAFGVSARPQKMSDLPAPECLWMDLSRAGDRLLCGEELQLSLWDLPAAGAPRRRWAAPLQISSGSLPASPDAMIPLWRHDFTRLLIDPADGRVGQAWALQVGGRIGQDRDRVVFYNPTLFHLFDGEGRLISGDNGCLSEIAAAAIGDTIVQSCKDGRLRRLTRDGALIGEVQTLLKNDQEVSVLLPVERPGAPLELIVGTIRGEVGQLDPITGDWVRSVASGMGMIRQLTLRPDGAVAVIGSTGGVRLWSPQTGAWLAVLPGGARLAAFRPDGTLLLAGRRVQSWRLPGHATPATFPAGAGLSGVTASPDGRLIAMALADGRVRVADIGSGALVADVRIADAVVKALDFSPDGRTLTATSRQGLMTATIDTRTWIATALPDPQPLRRISAMADGRIIGVSYGTRLLVWAADRRQSETRLESAVADLATDPGNTRAVMVDERGWLLELIAGAQEGAPQAAPLPLWTQPGLIGADISASGRVIAAITDLRLLLLDRTSGGRPGMNQIQIRWEIDVPAPRDVAISPDDRYVAVGGLDGRARVYDTATGELHAVLSGHTDRISGVGFTPSGLLLTASWDHSARVWDLSVLDAPAAALIAAIRNDWGLTLQDVLE